MGCPLPLLADFDALALRLLARESIEAKQARRLLTLASIYDGGSRTEAAKIGDVTVQVVRDWVERFNARGPAGLINRKAPGASAKLAEEHRHALRAIIDAGPIPAVHGVVRWRLVDLVQWLWEEFRVSVSRQTLSRELHALGYAKLSARPRHHGQNPDALEAFKKASQPRSRRSSRLKPMASG